MEINIQPIYGVSPALVKILDKHYEEISSYPSEEMFEPSATDLIAKNAKFFEVKYNFEIIAIGGIMFHDNIGEISKFYILQEYRGKGIADKILEKTLEEAKKMQIKDIRLETGNKQSAALKFFRKHGFIDCDPFMPYLNYSPFVIDHSVFMRKILK